MAKPVDETTKIISHHNGVIRSRPRVVTCHSQLTDPSVSYVTLSTQRPIRILRLTLNSVAHPYPTSHSQLSGPSVSYVSLSTQWPIRILRLTLNSVAHPYPTSHSQLSGPSVSYVSLSTQLSPVRLLRDSLGHSVESDPSPTDGHSQLSVPIRILRLTGPLSCPVRILGYSLSSTQLRVIRILRVTLNSAAHPYPDVDTLHVSGPSVWATSHSPLTDPSVYLCHTLQFSVPIRILRLTLNSVAHP